jgi:hypothetical protein
VEHDRTSVVGQGFQRFEAFVRKARLPVQRQDGLPDAGSPTTR